MKKTLILILLVSTFKLFAQHPDLEQRWYVQSITINSITAETPTDLINFPFAYLNFLGGTTNLTISENLTVNGNCQIGFTSHVNYISTNIFEFIDFTPFYTDTECSTSLIDFMNLYVGFYEDYVTEQFIYSITTEVDNSKTLLIVNNNGDEVIFTNTFLNPPPQSIVSNNWSLHNLIINNIDNIPPNNSEIINIRLSINEGNGGFFTSVCSFFESTPFFDLINSTFYMYESATDYGMTTCSPTYPENNTFTDLYISDFYLDNLPGPFSYEHIINGSNETLTITNAIGNQAVYGNFTQSTQEFTNSLFSIYPNPVKEFINIELPNNEKILQVSVYNFLEKKILTTTENSINLSKYENGIYFVKILTENGSSSTKKIIKIGA